MEKYVPSERAFTVWSQPEGKGKAEKLGEFRTRKDAESQAQRIIGLGKHKSVSVHSPVKVGEEELSSFTADE